MKVHAWTKKIIDFWKWFKTSMKKVKEGNRIIRRAKKEKYVRERGVFVYVCECVCVCMCARLISKWDDLFETHRSVPEISDSAMKMSDLSQERGDVSLSRSIEVGIWRTQWSSILDVLVHSWKKGDENLFLAVLFWKINKLLFVLTYAN